MPDHRKVSTSRKTLRLLITTAIIFLLAGTLAVVGILMIQKAKPPVPEQAIAEAKLTTEALKSDGNP